MLSVKPFNMDALLTYANETHCIFEGVILQYSYNMRYFEIRNKINYFIPAGTKCIGICIVQLGWSGGHTRGTVRLNVISFIL